MLLLVAWVSHELFDVPMSVGGFPAAGFSLDAIVAASSARSRSASCPPSWGWSSTTELAAAPATVPTRALAEAARRFGTPVHVTSVAALEAAARELEAAFPDPWLRAFSVKANDVPAIVARLGSLGLGANVVSRGEWAVATAAGIPNARITLEGVGKSDDDLRAAVRAAAAGDPLRWVAVESAEELDALDRAGAAGRASAGTAARRSTSSSA